MNNDTPSDKKVSFKVATSTPAFALVGVKQSKKKKKELNRLLIDNKSKSFTVAANGNKRVIVHANIAQAFVQATLTLNALTDSFVIFFYYIIILFPSHHITFLSFF